MATLVVIMNRDFDGHKSGKQYSIEISLARRYVQNGYAVPLSVHLDQMAEQKRLEEQAKEQAEADKAKKKELLKAKDESTKETAESQPAFKRTKAIKK